MARATGADARCPACATRSSAVHSTYIRRTCPRSATPSGSRRACAAGLLDVRACRTRRLTAAQCAVAVETGAEAGACLARRRRAAARDADEPRHAAAAAPARAAAQGGGAALGRGRFDWTLKRAPPRTYSTILVDRTARSARRAAWSTCCPTAAARCSPAGCGSGSTSRWHKTVRCRSCGARPLDRVRAGYHGRAPRRDPGRGPLAPVAQRAPDARALVRHGRWAAAQAAGGARGTPRAGVARTAPFPRSPTEVLTAAGARERWRAVYDNVRRRHGQAPGLPGASR